MLGRWMSLRIHVLHSHRDLHDDNLGAINGEGFHQDNKHTGTTLSGKVGSNHDAEQC